MTTFDLQGIGMTSARTRKRLIERLKEAGVKDHEVLSAMFSVPRHIFVDEALAHRAYEDTALPIGHAQTISQPYIVARMSELLREKGPLGRVLEVGTGSGYQAAIMARLAQSVYTVERIEPLLTRAVKRFRALRLDNIYSRLSDGSWGWQEKAPFDGIIVTCAPSVIPPELLDQLVDGGRLVAPVGEDGAQVLKVYQRTGDRFVEKTVESVRFVPLLPGVVR